MKRVEAERADTYELLHQSKWWRIGDGSAIKVAKMSPEHQANTLAYLVRNSRRLIPDPCRGAWFSVPDEVWDDYEHMLANPQTWVLGTPLCRALLSALGRIALGE